MSSEKKLYVLDERLRATDQRSYGVQKGAQSTTHSPFNAVSATANQKNFNIQGPSQETMISRDVIIQATLTFEITVPIVADGNQLRSAVRFLFGKTDGLAPLPLHQLIMSMNTTINNNTVTVKAEEALSVLLRLLSPEALAKYESTTPVLPECKWITMTQKVLTHMRRQLEMLKMLQGPAQPRPSLHLQMSQEHLAMLAPVPQAITATR